MKLLHIDSSVLGPHSVSRQVSAAIVERLRQSTPGLEVSYRDLTLAPLAHLTGSHLAAGQGATPDASLREDIAAGQAVLHLHVHLIPRYSGDSQQPRGGIRWVIPEKANYWTRQT